MSRIRNGNEAPDAPYVLRTIAELYAALDAMPAVLREAILFGPEEYDTVAPMETLMNPPEGFRHLPRQFLTQSFAKQLIGTVPERRVASSLHPARGIDRYPINPPPALRRLRSGKRPTFQPRPKP